MRRARGLDAVIRVRGRNSERQIPIAEFHRPPGDHPELDSTLRSDELIVSIDLPPSRFGEHSHYLKVRDRASYEFALVSAAVGLEIIGNNIRTARIVLGGVAHKPWRVESAEQILAGQTRSRQLFERAADQAVTGAKPQSQNGFKVELAKRAVARALSVAGGLA